MSDILTLSQIKVPGTASTKDDAIREAGQLLVDAGAVSPEYVDAMFEREKSVSTYMGNYLAIPHGTNEAKDTIARSGLSVVRYDQPIDWDGNEVQSGRSRSPPTWGTTGQSRTARTRRRTPSPVRGCPWSGTTSRSTGTATRCRAEEVGLHLHGELPGNPARHERGEGHHRPFGAVRGPVRPADRLGRQRG